MASERTSPTAALVLRERNRGSDMICASSCLNDKKGSPVRCFELSSAFEQLPEELLRVLLTFNPIDELLVTVSRVCRKTRDLLAKMLDRESRCKEKELLDAYDTLRKLHERYMKLQKESAEKLQVRGILFDLFQHSTSRMDRLVPTDDKELHTSLGMNLNQRTTFAQFRKVLGVYQALLMSRKQYMMRFYCSSESGSKKLKLTELGDKVSTQIFKYFDKDGDEKLSYPELKELNDYAGVPLAYETYELTLRKFDSEDGALTIAGLYIQLNIYVCYFVK